jgi:thiamine transport system substrate-binding protein
MSRKILVFTVFVSLLLAACTSSAYPTEVPGEPTTLTVMTHDSFSVSQEVLSAFETANNIKVNFVKGGDTGATLNRLILESLSGSTPSADVFFGLDNTFLSRALEQDLLEPYNAPQLAMIPAEFKLDPENRALPVDYGDVCINYDKAWFKQNDLPLPTSLAELTDPRYANLLVVENPATSSPGLAFMLTTIAEFGEDGWLDWWQAMKTNGVQITSDWETAYYTNFSGSSGRGAQPMVVSYASSPAAEFIYAETELDESPTASLTGAGMCWRQIEFAGILKGTKNRAAAEKFIDFLLSQPFQEDVPMQMFVFPVLPEAVIPEAFQKTVESPEQPASLAPELIASKRDAWINAWTNLMLN